eukprot:8070680-Alexandrium_andersonii.AAC.1
MLKSISARPLRPLTGASLCQASGGKWCKCLLSPSDTSVASVSTRHDLIDLLDSELPLASSTPWGGAAGLPSVVRRGATFRHGHHRERGA